mgnify:CR=1 FL=1
MYRVLLEISTPYRVFCKVRVLPIRHQPIDLGKGIRSFALATKKPSGVASSQLSQGTRNRFWEIHKFFFMVGREVHSLPISSYFVILIVFVIVIKKSIRMTSMIRIRKVMLSFRKAYVLTIDTRPSNQFSVRSSEHKAEWGDLRKFDVDDRFGGFHRHGIQASEQAIRPYVPS